MKINVLGDTVELTVEDFLNGTLEVKEEDAAKKIKVQEIQMKNTQAEFLLKTKKLFEVDKEITDKCLIITDISFIGEKPVFGDLLAMIGIEDSKFLMKNENFLKLADLGIEQSDDFLLFQMKIMILVMILLEKLHLQLNIIM